MSIEELSLMLYDTFQMDIWFPSYSVLNKEFEKSSYSVWAIDELVEYVTKRLALRKEGSISDIVQITTEFQKKMAEYSQINPNNNLMFSVAHDILADVLEILRAME